MGLDHQDLPEMAVANLHDREDPRDELDDAVAVAFPGVQDAVAADATTCHAVAYPGATS